MLDLGVPIGHLWEDSCHYGLELECPQNPHVVKGEALGRCLDCRHSVLTSGFIYQSVQVLSVQSGCGSGWKTWVIGGVILKALLPSLPPPIPLFLLTIVVQTAFLCAGASSLMFLPSSQPTMD